MKPLGGNSLYNDTIRIIVIDDDFSKQKLSFMTFCKLLTGKTSREIMTKDQCIIEGIGFKMRFITKPNNKDYVRGMRCDYIINNTQDATFHSEVALPMMSMSMFLRST